MKKMLALGSGALCLAAASLVAAPPAQAASCVVTQYVGKVTTSNIVKSTVVTHATQYVVPPNGSLTSTRTAERRKVLSGSFNYSGGAQASTGLVPKIIGSAKVSTKVTISGQGVSTKSTAETVTFSYKNTTKKNQTIIAYVGTTQYVGKWAVTGCRGSGGQSTVGTVYTASTGKFDSWEGRGTGWVQCSAAGGSALSTAAKKFC